MSVLSNQKIDDVISFAESLIGIKYVKWEQGKDYNFHCDEIPSLEMLKMEGVCCSSFINILMLYSGKIIPENRNIMRGGTLYWAVFFRDNNVLEKFDYTKKYPLGTIFLRNFYNETDQGHMAMLTDYNKDEPDKILYSKIIHAYIYNNHCAVGKTSLGVSHFSSDDDTGYYEYAVLPQKWYDSLPFK
tara:strand:- start:5208 stop:5768 length:561 start_codon:yes stop_codon:yes gene_type:complete